MYNTLQSGQVAKKKDAPCLGPNVSAGNGPRWRLKDTPTAAIFCCKGTDQHVKIRSKISLRSAARLLIKNVPSLAHVSTLEFAAIFLLPMRKYGLSFLLSEWRFKANFQPV
jgi:hypothetical protein